MKGYQPQIEVSQIQQNNALVQWKKTKSFLQCFYALSNGSQSLANRLT